MNNMGRKTLHFTVPHRHASAATYCFLSNLHSRQVGGKRERAARGSKMRSKAEKRPQQLGGKRQAEGRWPLQRCFPSSSPSRIFRLTYTVIWQRWPGPPECFHLPVWLSASVFICSSVCLTVHVLSIYLLLHHHLSLSIRLSSVCAVGKT